MIGYVAVLGGAEIYFPLAFANTVDGTHIPIPISHLLNKFAVGGVVIDMSPAIAIAQPQKGTVPQPPQAFIIDSNPRLGRLAKHRRRFSVIGVGGIQIDK